MKRLFTGVFDLSVVASSYDSAAALIPGGNLLLAVLQKGHPTEPKTAKGTRLLLTTDNYLAQLSPALQTLEPEKQGRSPKKGGGSGKYKAMLVAVSAARGGGCTHGSVQFGRQRRPVHRKKSGGQDSAILVVLDFNALNGGTKAPAHVV